MDAFEKAVAHAMVWEVGPWFNENDPETQAGLIATKAQRRKCGYVNDPVDAGGETKYGVAKSGNPTTNITALDWAGAKAIYKQRYWIEGGCHLITSPALAQLHFDGCVNHGVVRASKFLQEIAGISAAGQDGKIGPFTAGKVNAAQPLVLGDLLCDRREAFYRSIVANKPAQIKFLNGWLNRINDARVQLHA